MEQSGRRGVGPPGVLLGVHGAANATGTAGQAPDSLCAQCGRLGPESRRPLGPPMQVLDCSSASIAVIRRLSCADPVAGRRWRERRPLLGRLEGANEDLEEALGGAPVLGSMVGVELGHGERAYTCVGE